MTGFGVRVGQQSLGQALDVCTKPEIRPEHQHDGYLLYASCVTAAMMMQVRVSIRMCRDCHRAFELASTLYGDVMCDDGCTVHTFHHGRSLLSDSLLTSSASLSALTLQYAQYYTHCRTLDRNMSQRESAV